MKIVVIGGGPGGYVAAIRCAQYGGDVTLIEDAIVISRVTRAPEKKVFYIDTGRLPRAKAESYIQQLMNKHRNQMSYNYQTGAVENRKRSISLLEDFWIPRCLSLNTQIHTCSKDSLDGISISLKDIISKYESNQEIYVPAISSSGQIQPKLIEWAGITRRDAKVIEIELENGEIIKCTPDHKFLVWTDDLKTSWYYVEAQNLTDDMELVEHSLDINYA